MRKTFGVFSDSHFGSPYGLMPPGWADVDGRPIGQSKEQAHIWQCFEHRLAAAQAQFPQLDGIIMNGDTIDGNPGKLFDIQTSISRPEDQISLAVHGLRSVQSRWPSSSWHFVQGTKNHETPEQVRQIAQYFNGTYVASSYEFWVGKAGVQFGHEISGKAIATLLKEFADSDRNTARFDFSRIHVYVRSHLHDGSLFRQAGAVMFLTFPLQRPTMFMRSKTPNRPMPVLGFSILVIDDEPLAVGGSPLTSTDFTFVLPESIYRA